MINKKRELFLNTILSALFFLTFFVSPVKASELYLPSDFKTPGLSIDFFSFSNINKPSTGTLLLNFGPDKPAIAAKESSGLNILAYQEASPIPSIKPVSSPKAVVKNEGKTASPSSSVKNEPSAKPSLSPAAIETPAPTKKPSLPKEEENKQEIKVVNQTNGLDPEKLFNMVNDYRAEKGLPSLQKDDKVCKLAQERAPEIGAEINGGYMHKGLKNRNLDYWNSENIIGMNSEEKAFNWWINDYIHRVQIEGDFKYSCVACSGYFCAQEFTNYSPKS